MTASEFSPPTCRTRRVRAGRGLVVVLSVSAVLTLSACGNDLGTVDDGPAPSLSPPDRALPLWPGYTPPTSPSETDLPPDHYDPIEGLRVSVPISRAEAVDLLGADPNISARFSSTVYQCFERPEKGCPTLRPVAHRDFTGDGKDEAVVAVDEPAADQTLLAVYRITDGGSRALPLLVEVLSLGSMASTVGRDLLVTSPDPYNHTLTVSRYGWNGETLSLNNTSRSDNLDLPDPEAQ